MLLRRATKWAAVGLTAHQVRHAYRNKTRSRPGQEAKEKRPEPSTTDRTKPAGGWETTGQCPTHGARACGWTTSHVHVGQTGDGRAGKARLCLPGHPCTETTHTLGVDGTRRLWALDWVMTKKGLLQYLGLAPLSHSGEGETEDTTDPQEPGAEPETAPDRHRSRRSRREGEDPPDRRDDRREGSPPPPERDHGTDYGLPDSAPIAGREA
jgi:hypothetical protein